MMPTVTKESAKAFRDLIDYTSRHLRVLKVLGSPTETWDELVMHMMEIKFDARTLCAWEEEIDRNEDARLEDMLEFLKRKCQTLERIESRTADKVEKSYKEGESRNKGSATTGSKWPYSAKGTVKTISLAISINSGRCSFCTGSHFIYFCEKFLDLPVPDRIKEVRRLKLCSNCLKNDHYAKTCKLGHCRECEEKHNTLCHVSPVSKSTTKSDVSESKNETSNEASSNMAVHTSNIRGRRVLMATAMVEATQRNGSSIPIRVLLDSASEANFITQAAHNKLGLKRNRVSEVVTGLNEIESKISGICDIHVKSKYSNFEINAQCLIVPKITKNLPSMKIECSKLQIPERFWKLENYGDNDERVLSLNEKKCEPHFEQNTTRVSGRFIVKLPFHDENLPIGNNREIAYKRLNHLERNLMGNAVIRERYINFMREYTELGHMSVVDEPNHNFKNIVYLPHHGVLKESSSSTKLRVVFDASAKNSQGLEWNPSSDEFYFEARMATCVSTKRKMLSEISKLFDLLGLIGPVLTAAKILMQGLWEIKIDWDDPLPREISDKWKDFQEDIIEILPTNHWNHVKGLENPADLISGATPAQLKDNYLWWNGPRWLTEPPQSAESDNYNCELTDDDRHHAERETRRESRVCNFIITQPSSLNEIICKLIEDCSTLTKIERSLAYCLRFISNCRKGKKHRVLTGLTLTELDLARREIIKYSQRTPRRNQEPSK
ncbi:hypothetical protein RF55_10829 [Lasius niger]|uniref:Uncharacterized protein n=1 Tax=Lasius niger TaxID=67767 RepID=A0A0J7KGJ0_LASNI|nr:hypothetical protein RF55_10829 [Lasius niger]